MFCRNCNFLFRMSTRTKFLLLRNIGNASCTGDRDPAPLFFNANVQQILKKLTRVDIQKVFRARRLGKDLKTPEYKFLTTEELNEEMQKIDEMVEKKLQMPPVVKRCSDEVEVLSKDYELQGAADCKFVFTDISYAVPDRERLIVVREPDGVLRKANADERHRMIETYFPVQDRMIRMPHMFEKEYLKKLLLREEYEFVLDRACLQFEPDDPVYQEVTTTTYDAVDEAQHYDALRSTRHFGPFTFHLAWNKRVDNLLQDLIRNDRLDEAAALVQLYHLLNPDAKSASIKFEPGKESEFVQKFIESDSKKRAVLELVLAANRELHKEQDKTEAGVRKAHGQSQ